jgi:two-component system response regulator FixJ
VNLSNPIVPTVAVIESDAGAQDSLTALLRSADIQVKSYESHQAFFDGFVEGDVHYVLSTGHLPGMDGLGVQKELLRRKIDLPVILLTGHGDIDMAVRAMKAGAVDFIERPVDAARLFKSVKACLYRGVHERRLASRAKIIEPRIGSLTPREREVFEHLLSGDPSTVISSDLDISPRTLEVHRSRLMQKMHARSLAALVFPATLSPTLSHRREIRRAAQACPLAGVVRAAHDVVLKPCDGPCDLQKCQCSGGISRGIQVHELHRGRPPGPASMERYEVTGAAPDNGVIRIASVRRRKIPPRLTWRRRQIAVV